MIIIFVCHDPPLAGQFKSLFPSNGGTNAVFWIPPLHFLCDWCWPCFYIVTISTSTTKCFSPFSFMRQIIKRVAKCMNALNFDILDEVATLHFNMHDIGDEVTHYFATNQHHSNFSTSRLHMKHIPFLSGIPLRQRQCRCKPNMCISCFMKPVISCEVLGGGERFLDRKSINWLKESHSLKVRNGPAVSRTRWLGFDSITGGSGGMFGCLLKFSASLDLNGTCEGWNWNLSLAGQGTIKV